MFLFTGEHLSFGQQQILDSLWEIVNNKTQVDTTRLKGLHEIVRTYIYSKPDTGIILAEQELSLARQTKHQLFEGKALNAMGVAYLTKENYTKAIECYGKALNIRELINDREGVIQTCRNIAHVYKTQGNTYKALEFWFQRLKKLESSGQKKEQYQRERVAYLTSISLIYADQGEKIQALENYKTISSIYNQLKDTMQLAEALVQTGNLYGDIKDVKNAMQSFQKAIVLFQKVHRKEGIRLAYNCMALTYQENDDPENALLYFEKSLSVAEQIQDKYWIAVLFDNIGHHYFEQDQFSKSLEFNYKALQINKELKVEHRMAWSYYNLAKNYMKQKNYVKAREYMDLSMEIRAKDAFLSDANAELLASRIDSAINNKNGAYEHYKKYIVLRDQLNNADIKRSATKEKYQSQYDKQKAIDKVEQEKKDIVTANEKRKQQLIIWSVAGGLIVVAGFAGYVFYSLRITRKQKELIERKEKETAEQKREIEEKQKEIIDSITYARRIQRALITNEKYIDKSLNRLQDKTH